MLKYCITAFAIIIFLTSYSQKFNGKGGYIQDYSGEYYRQEFLCEVYDLPNKADTLFGLEKVNISIRHNRISDLKISLEAPDGSSFWLTNRNGRDTGKNYLNTEFSMEAKEYIHQGIAPFAGEYIPDGRMEYLNNGQNPNGYWKLIVEDLRKTVDGFLDSFSITFSNHPARIKLVKRCSFSNPELCVCEGGKQSGDLLPDLIIIPSFTENQIQEYSWNDSIYPGQLRFAATIGNIGYGPMEIKGSKKWFCGDNEVDSSLKCGNGNNSRQLVYQVIYYKQGDSIKSRLVPSGTMYMDDHPGHNHYHVDDWVEFRLVKIDKKQRRREISKGHKVSYCLFSSGICSSSDNVCKIYNQHFGETMPNYGLGNYSSCSTEKQGITVGGYDTYGLMYEGQYLQLPKGLKNGEYWLEIEIDPNHLYVERDKTNNTFRLKINIQKQQVQRN
ncbi:MAG: lysyl oxidase family protein [Ferruginibacter sp.]